MAAPNFWNHQESAQATVQALKKLKALVEPMNGVISAADDIAVMLELLDDEDDAQTREELENDLGRLRENVDRVQLLALLSGPNDARDCFFSIQAGTGGADAQDWAAMMLRMYLRYFERNGYAAEELALKEGEEAGIQSANLLIKGPYAYGYLSCEMGVHRMERISPFNAQGKRQTSFASVDVVPELDDINIDIDWDKEVRDDTYRASGAGGQHVNKTDSAIRLTHLPTGTVVECQDERSQHKNKARAMSLLQAKIYDAEKQKQEKEQAAERKSLIGSGDRSERIRTYNFPQGRLTDHRINLTLYKLEEILGGALDYVAEPLMHEFQAEQLAKLADDTEGL